MNDTDLSKSKIININDFIFRQNLEFYPNLQGLSCKGNTIYYTVNNELLAAEPLTFDLRNLPGNAWNVSPQEFVDIIKLNKECKGLYHFIDFIQKYTNNYSILQTGNEA